MPETTATPVLVSNVRSDDDHFMCCLVNYGTMGPRLCDGEIERFDGGYVDSVGCSRCNAADAADRCPVHGRCPYRRS